MSFSGAFQKIEVTDELDFCRSPVLEHFSYLVHFLIHKQTTRLRMKSIQIINPKCLGA